VDLVVSPALVGFNTQSNGHGAVLTPGQLIDALVLQLLDATTARLSVAGNIFDVKTQVPLEPGSAVRLAVRGHGNETRLVIVGQGVPPPINGAPPSQPKQTPPTPQPQRGQQQIPASLPQIVAAPSEETEQAAPLVHTTDAPPLAPKQAMREADPALALTTATRAAAAQQKSLAPVFAQAGVVVEAPGVPEPVKQAAFKLLMLRAPFGAEIAPEEIQKAVRGTGLFLEAKLVATARANGSLPPLPSALTPAAPVAAPAATVPFVPGADMKAMLFTLREALRQWLDPVADAVRLVKANAGPEAASGLLPRTAAAPPPPAPTHGDEMVAVAKSLVAEAKTPPPPYRNAPTQGEQPAAAAAPAGTPARLLGHVLLEETTAALARTTLMQAASLPGAASAVAEHADAGGTHWNFEIPFIVAQGTAIAHFEISRDEHKAAAAERRPPGWRVNFSVDVEPMGPVHAQVALTGHRAAVRLWAERAPTAGALRDSVGDLNAALKQAALEPAEIVVRDGAPPRPLKPGAGRFVDRAS
jgi:hypothetical protein